MSLDPENPRRSEIEPWLQAQWATLADGESRIAFPPGESCFSSLRRRGWRLEIDPGGFRAPFTVDFSGETPWEVVVTTAEPVPLVRWYRVNDGRHDFTVSASPEFERLMAVAGRSGLPIWLLGQAAALIADRRGCELREAWDRLALNLENMEKGLYFSGWSYGGRIGDTITGAIPRFLR